MLIQGGSQATIVKPDFGELALTNRGGLINPVLTFLYSVLALRQLVCAVLHLSTVQVLVRPPASLR